MTVAELIVALQELPQDLQVILPLYSEYCLLEPTGIIRDQQQVARDDGWVGCARRDKPLQEYVTLYP